MLTQKMRLYAEARLSGKNQTDAAIYAQCPEATARQAASRYEKHPDVIAHIARMRAGIPEPVPEPKEVFSKPPTPSAMALAAQVGTEHESLQYFRSVMNDTGEDPKLRLEAAKALATFTLAKPGEKGKKEDRQDAAEKAVNNFAANPPPKLAAVGGRKV